MACSYVNDVYIYSPRYHKTLPATTLQDEQATGAE
jgi:hypothetical protein